MKDCDAGHILANQLGGIGSQPINIFPQDLHINRGAYKSFETKIYNCISTTGAVANLQWHFIYQNDTETKPTSVIYNATFSSGSCAPGFSTVLTNCYTACSVTGTSSSPTIQPNSRIVSSSPSLATPSSSGPHSSPTATPSTSNNNGNSSSRSQSSTISSPGIIAAIVLSSIIIVIAALVFAYRYYKYYYTPKSNGVMFKWNEEAM